MSTSTPNLVTIKVTPAAREWLMREKAISGDPVHKTVDGLIALAVAVSDAEKEKTK